MNITTEEKIQNAITWIKGLSNTKFPQDIGQLGDKEKGFCCLGYGCERLKIDYTIDAGTSKKLMEKVGLLNPAGEIDEALIPLAENADEAYYTIVDLNDSAGYSFKRISTVLKNRAYDIFEADVADGIKQYFKKK